MEEENVGEVVAAASDFMRGDLRRQGVDIHLDVAPELSSVLVDEGQIRQALFNLLRNAGEAMPAGGTITLRVLKAAGGGVDVLVDDEGPGIDPAARARLFEPFFTTKNHGTGLGLAITRQIIQSHGGSITCTVNEPRGTRFVIHLPPPKTEEQRTNEDPIS